MKHGIIYFLHLSNVIWGFRISIIPLIIIGINSPIRGALFPVAWGLCALALLVSFCTITIRPPSTESVKKAIGKHRSEFESKVLDKRKGIRNSQYAVISGYTFGGALKLKRKVGNNWIFDHLVLISAISSPEGLTLYGENISLLKNNDTEHFLYEKLTPSDVIITSEVYSEDYNINKLTIKVKDDSITTYVVNDYHLRDFQASINQ